MTELILGTAQFGNAYGATNAIGRLGDSDVAELLGMARAAGIRTLDTAADYGDSQERLGRLAPAGNRYITKFSLGEGRPAAEWLYDRSRRMLGVESLQGVLFHRLSDLHDPRCAETVDLLREGRAAGVIDRIGVSIYDAADLELALSVFPDLDLLQLPANILDRRLLDDAGVAALAARGVLLHVRSAFLQGILLADPDTLAPFFQALAPVLRELRRVALESGVTLAGLLLRYLRDHPLVGGVVVGATTRAELAEITAEWSAAVVVPLPEVDDLPAKLLDPRLWPR